MSYFLCAFCDMIEKSEVNAVLTFYLGPDHKVYGRELMKKLVQNTANVEAGSYLLVPEQYSFETERELCLLGGDSISRYAEVLSLSRLASRVESIYGGGAAVWLDRGGRLLAAAQAVEQVHSRLKMYAGACRRTEFLEMLLSVIDEFGSYGIEVSDLISLAEKNEGIFAQKLSELALLYESYIAVTAKAADPVTRLKHLRNVLRQCDFAEGKRFYIYGFVDFTLLEREIIQELILAADEVTLALPFEIIGGDNVFPSAADTVREFTEFCHRMNIAVKKELFGFDTTVHKDILHLQMTVPHGKTEDTVCGSTVVRVQKFSGREEECRHAAKTIAQLVSAGTKYNEIGIACADQRAYSTALSTVLDKVGIPYYISEKTPLTESTAARMLLSGLRAATERMDGSVMLDYLKCGAVQLSDDACDRLENYAKLWNIKERQWMAEWTMHPQGICDKWTDGDIACLRQLNAWRESGLVPIFHLADALKNAKNVGEMAQATFAFAEEISLHKRLQELSDQFFEVQDYAKAQRYGQIYEILMDGLEQLSMVLSDAVRTPQEFCRLYEKLLSQYHVSSVPATLNEVMIGDINTFSGRRVKHLLVLGASEGSFPAYGSGVGAFTEDERRVLIHQGLRMAPLRADVMDRELGKIYSLLRSVEESITLSCTGTEPSYLLEQIAAMYGGWDNQTETVLLDEREWLTECVRLNCEDLVSEELRPVLEDLKERREYGFGIISAETVERLYGKDLHLSASKIDKFAACRFAYFLRYGLKADPQETATFDAAEFGTFAHAILENTAKAVMEEGGFHKVGLERTLELANKFMTEYYDTVLQDLGSSREGFRYLFQRNCQEVSFVAENLWEELHTAAFEPVAFELGFGEDKDLEAVTIKGQKGTGHITGFVDRVDLYRNGDATYVRVVDYKTGKKTFDYTDLSVGEGLQMLIYLFALQDNGEAYFGTKLQPAGVLYHLARKDIHSCQHWPTVEETQKLQRDADGRKGLLLDDDIILFAMEHFEDNPRYLPFKIRKDGARSGDLATREEMRALKQYVFETLQRLTDEMLSGEVMPNPIVRGAGNSACTYCDFAEVCQKDFAKHQERKLRGITNRDFFRNICKKEVADHEQNGTDAGTESGS